MSKQDYSKNSNNKQDYSIGYRIIKMCISLILVLIIVLLITNFAWLYYFSQFDISTISQDGKGINIIGNTHSEVNNGSNSNN